MPPNRSFLVLLLALPLGACLGPAVRPVELAEPGHVEASLGLALPNFDEVSAQAAVGLAPHLELEASGAGNWDSENPPDWRLDARLRGQIPVAGPVSVDLGLGVAESYYTATQQSCSMSCNSPLRSRYLTGETGLVWHLPPIAFGTWIDHAVAFSEGENCYASPGFTAVNYVLGGTIGVEFDVASFFHFLINLSTGSALYPTNLDNARTAIEWFDAGLGLEFIL